MENMIITGTITATSNKISEDFKTEHPTKCAYISIDKSVDKKALEAFGIKIYSSADKNEFLAIRTSRQIAIYDSTTGDNEPVDRLDCSIEDDTGIKTPNFRTIEGVQFNLVKGEKLGNEFIRLQAISGPADCITYVTANNPFIEG